MGTAFTEVVGEQNSNDFMGVFSVWGRGEPMATFYVFFLNQSCKLDGSCKVIPCLLTMERVFQ